MRLITGSIWFFYMLFTLYTGIVYALCYWVPTPNWLAGFVMLSFPLVLAGHLFFLGFWLFLRPLRTLLPVAMLLLSFPFWQRTYKVPSESEPENDAPTLKIVNYNVASFQLLHNNTPFTREVLTWLKGVNPDVICFQEFSNRKNRARATVVEQLKDAGYPYHRTLMIPGAAAGGYITGVVTFSKYPIVASEDSHFAGQNGILRTDIRWNNDTIRIINTHLYSMTLKLNRLANQTEYSGVKKETRGTLRQMKKGFEERNDELMQIESWISDSRHPLVICGDFNETPYGYVYGRLRRKLANAFEDQGRGFGFSYNRLPYFIRIDHQFYSRDRLLLREFQTRRKVPYSDHYPLMAIYSLQPTDKD
jgi:endonuclease/exonuclease/phosphatase family metal-dependent hydrolase